MTDLKSFKAPGLSWRPRNGGRWEARWRPHSDFVARGYSKSTSTLWLGKPEDFTEVNMAYIKKRCEVLHSEMSKSAIGVAMTGALVEPGVIEFDHTIAGLIRCYQTDRDSRYQKLRHCSRKTLDSHLRIIKADHGGVRVEDIKGRNLLRWHEDWLPRGATMAHGLIGAMRTIMTFGKTILDDPHCKAVKELLRDMKFSRPGKRKEIISADQAVAVRLRAHETGFHSIALAQAFQFDGTLRQKDVIGEWVPNSEPEISDILAYGEKWLRGLRWNEIDDNLILLHTTSKKLKEIEIDLRLAPMVLEELKIAYGLDLAEGLDRSKLPSSGPIILSDEDIPWQAYNFRREWRKIATAAGVPKHVWNMDSRAGAITEATDSGASLEDTRHAATHSDTKTTAGYSRGSAGKVSRVMQMRAAHRNKAGK